MGASEKFDEQLFSIKLFELRPLLQIDGSFFPTNGVIDIYPVSLRERLEGIDRICREVWQIQGKTVTPEFVREVLVPKVITQIDAVVGESVTRSSATDLERWGPAWAFLAGKVGELRSEFANRYEIEARTLEHKKTHKPKLKVPAPIRPVNTARTVTQAPAPPTAIGGGGYFSPAPKPTRMPSRPDDFPSDLWPRAVGILSKAIQKFPNQKQLQELCEHVTEKMTPLYCEAVETGKMKAGSVLTEGSGMEELLRLLLAANDPGHSSWGISNQAWEILQTVKTATWGKLAEAISGVQQGTANQIKPAPSGVPKMQSTAIIPGQFAGLPSWQLTELMQRRVKPADLRTEENQNAQSPDPVLETFNRCDAEVASEQISAKNSGKTTQGAESKPVDLPVAGGREKVDAFIAEVLAKTGTKISRKDIWLVAGYKNPTEFERFQRDDERATLAAVNNFHRVLRMKPEDFIRSLKTIKASKKA